MRRSEVVRRGHRAEREIDVQFVGIGIVVPQFVARERLEAAVMDAVRQGDVGQRLVGYREVPEVLGVETVPRLVALVVPEVRTARGNALVGAKEWIELTRQPALGHGEGEPTGLGPVRIVARRWMELVIGMRLRHDRLLEGATHTFCFVRTVTLLPLSGTLGAEVTGVGEPRVDRLGDDGGRRAERE